MLSSMANRSVDSVTPCPTTCSCPMWRTFPKESWSNPHAMDSEPQTTVEGLHRWGYNSTLVYHREIGMSQRGSPHRTEPSQCCKRIRKHDLKDSVSSTGTHIDPHLGQDGAQVDIPNISPLFACSSKEERLGRRAACPRDLCVETRLAKQDVGRAPNVFECNSVQDECQTLGTCTVACSVSVSRQDTVDQSSYCSSKSRFSSTKCNSFQRLQVTSLNDSHVYMYILPLFILMCTFKETIVQYSSVFSHAKDKHRTTSYTSSHRKTFPRRSVLGSICVNRGLPSLFLLLLFCSLTYASEQSCPNNCTCSPIPSPTLPPDKWASLIPSATPTLLASIISPQSVYAGKLPFLLHPKLIQNLTKMLNKSNSRHRERKIHRSHLLERSSDKIITEGGAKFKRDIRHFGSSHARPHIQESIVELYPSSSSTSDDEPGERANEIDGSDENIQGKDQSPRKPHYMQNFNLQSYLNDPYGSHFSINKKLNSSDSGLHSRRSNSTSSSFGGEGGGSRVPQVIQEQIPDLYRGFPGGGNLREEIRWGVANGTGETGASAEGTSPSEGHNVGPFQEPLAVVCEMAGLRSPPGLDDVTPDFDFQGVISLDLSCNNLTNLSSSSLTAYTDLRYLSVRNNLLSAVHPEALSTQTHLDTLDLSENQLEEIPSAVRSCPRLRLLLLTDNQISYVGEAALQGLSSLQWVDLKSNPLLTVHHLAFSSLPSLTKL